MRVLQCHNFYQQPGGEDNVVADELSLLRDRGHAVEPFRMHNDDVQDMSRPRLMAHTIWSRSSHRAIRDRIRSFKPDVMHVHNTLPLISPSIYYAANAEGVAVVQTLHNYRMLCPAALCMRDGKVCELCKTKRFKWPAVRHACYRGSRPATAAIAGMLAVHSSLGTFNRLVDCYIACTDFARDKIAEGGIDAGKIVIKPNFLASDQPAGTGRGGYAMFLGRLSPEKGIDTLLAAWEAGTGLLPLRIAGDGPMRPLVVAAAERVAGIEYMGHLDRQALLDALTNARILVFPSTSYEGMPLTLLESLRAGTPVVASRLGSMPCIIEAGVTGELFEPNDPDDLVRCVRRLAALSDTDAQQMRRTCRGTYEARYTPDSNYQQLISIYEQAVVRRRARSGQTIDLPLPQASAGERSIMEKGETPCVP